MSGDKNGLEDEESESLPTGFKTVYKIFENIQITSSSGYWSRVIETKFQCQNMISIDPYYELHKLYCIIDTA